MLPETSGWQLMALPQRCPFLFEVFAPRQPFLAVMHSLWTASCGHSLWRHPAEESVHTTLFHVLTSGSWCLTPRPGLRFRVCCLTFVIFVNFLNLNPCLYLLEVRTFISVLVVCNRYFSQLKEYMTSPCQALSVQTQQRCEDVSWVRQTALMM